MAKLMQLLLLCALLPAGALAQNGKTAENYPNRAIRFVVPTNPGGLSSLLAHWISKSLTDAWGQAVVVDNRPGAGQNYGSEIVAKSEPDGYTILLSGIANTVAPALYPKLAYDPIKDLAWITTIAKVPVLLVSNPSVPASNVKELIAYAKSQPGKLTFGSAGIGTSGHLAGELFKSIAKVDLTHVPYKGAAPAIVDTVAGRIDLYFGAMATPMQYVRAGRLRALGIASIKRSSAEPDIPTFDEQGLKGFDASTFYAVATRSGTPKEIIDKLNSEIVRIIKRPDEVSKKLGAAGAEFVADSAADVTAFVKNEIEKWGNVVKQSGTKME